MTPMASIDFGTGTATNKVRSRVARKRVDIEAKHQLTVRRKKEKITYLKTAIEEWTARGDTDYVRDLKRRLRIAEAQLAAMAP